MPEAPMGRRKNMNKKSNFSVIVKGFRLICKINLKYAGYTLLSIVCTVLASYIPIYLSAQIVNEIALLSGENASHDIAVQKAVLLIFVTVGVIWVLNFAGRAEKRHLQHHFLYGRKEAVCGKVDGHEIFGSGKKVHRAVKGEN